MGVNVPTEDVAAVDGDRIEVPTFAPSTVQLKLKASPLASAPVAVRRIGDPTPTLLPEDAGETLHVGGVFFVTVQVC